MLDLKGSLEKFYTKGDIHEFYNKAYTIVVSVCQKLPKGYSPHGVWNGDAFREVLHDVMVRLLKKDKLREYYELDLSNVNLVRIIKRTTKNLLIDGYRKRYPELSRLREILHKLLFTDEGFVEIRSSEGRMLGWGLAKQTAAKEYMINFQNALKQSQGIESISYLGSKKKFTKALQQLLIKIFETLDFPLSFEILFELVKSRVVMTDATIVSTEEAVGSGHNTNPLKIADTLSSNRDYDSDILDIKDQCEIIVKKLSPAQRKIWVFLYEGKTLDEIATLMDCARGTVAYQRDLIFKILKQNLSVQEQFSKFEEIFYERLKKISN